MSVYKRGSFYWYEFVWRGERIRQPTKQTNKRVAEQMEAAHKTALAKGEVGIRDRARIPTFRQFEDRFVKAIETECSDRPSTIEFYKAKLRYLLDYEPLAGCRLKLHRRGRRRRLQAAPSQPDKPTRQAPVRGFGEPRTGHSPTASSACP